MRRLLALVLVLAALGGAALLVRQGAVPGLGGDAALLKRRSHRFIECLKFKEFQEAARFHHPDELRQRSDIPKLLEDFFAIPPESLDIQDIQLDFVDFDSTHSRAKVKLTTTVNILNKKETQRPEVMLYWKLVGGEWYLDLRTTLERHPSAAR